MLPLATAWKSAPGPSRPPGSRQASAGSREPPKRLAGGRFRAQVVASEYSDWHADERTLGGWSYVKPGAAYRSNDRRLKKPILAGLGALAGEYVAEMFGTTAGAWLSGVAAAECVVEGLCSGLKPASDGAAAPGLGAAVLLAVVAVWC